MVRVDRHGHWVLHLRHVVVNARSLFNASFIVLVDLAHIKKHLSVDVLRALDLMVVQFRDFEDVIDLVQQWCLNIIKLLHDLEHFFVDIFRYLLYFFKQVVCLLLELALMTE